MANLFWKQKGRKALNLLATPFVSEEEFEKVKTFLPLFKKALESVTGQEK